MQSITAGARIPRRCGSVLDSRRCGNDGLFFFNDLFSAYLEEAKNGKVFLD
jgi:hypothetical protein